MADDRTVVRAPHLADESGARFRITEQRWIGAGEPVFVIAEIGNNHQGRMDLAMAAIDAAAAAGADAVTFQHAPLATYCIAAMYDHPNLAFLKQCELTVDQLAQLRARIKSLGMAFSVNVEDPETVDRMVALGIDFIKLCSADLTNIPYIQHCARTRLPIFFSTGAAWLGEIERAWNAMRAAGLQDFVIYHTNSGYPTPIDQAHLRQMDLLHQVFGGVKGYCDHTVDIIPPVVAAARGAKVIEKHITTDRALKGDDWMVSLEPEEFRRMATYIRQAEVALGTAVKRPLEIEQGTRTFKRKSIVSRRAVLAGQAISMDDLTYKLPGTGLPPYKAPDLIGRVAAMAIPADVLITEDMLAEPA